MADTFPLPIHCVYCGVALSALIEPLPEDAEELESGFPCPACQQVNRAKLGGQLVQVTRRVDPAGKVGQVH